MHPIAIGGSRRHRDTQASWTAIVARATPGGAFTFYIGDIVVSMSGSCADDLLARATDAATVVCFGVDRGDPPSPPSAAADILLQLQAGHLALGGAFSSGCAAPGDS